jgi:uncharacterized membrane protein
MTSPKLKDIKDIHDKKCDICKNPSDCLVCEFFTRSGKYEQLIDALMSGVDEDVDDILGHKKLLILKEHKQSVVDKIASFCGSAKILVLYTIITALWVLANKYVYAFDAYPYQFFNLVLAIVSVYSGILILIVNDRISNRDRKRAIKSEIDHHIINHKLAIIMKEKNKNEKKL